MGYYDLLFSVALLIGVISARGSIKNLIIDKSAKKFMRNITVVEFDIWIHENIFQIYSPIS